MDQWNIGVKVRSGGSPEAEERVSIQGYAITSYLADFVGVTASVAPALGEAWIGLTLAFYTDWPTSFGSQCSVSQVI
jgi:hypothetical protein